MGDKFFGKNNFFELLAGVDWFRSMIGNGSSAAEISARWASDVENFSPAARLTSFIPRYKAKTEARFSPGFG